MSLAEINVCPQCGKVLPAQAPEGLCPGCVARVSFALDPEPLSLGADDRSLLNDLPPRSATEAGGGARFGDYDLLAEIGRGGMGVVYRARQRSLKRLVALKMIPFGPLATQESIQRFRAEAEAVAQLQHPNIVAVFDTGQEEGQHFFSMELIEGGTLGDRLREGPLPARGGAEYLQTIAQAVHHAHERGILHRDLKPSNILLDGNGEPRIADFGLAKRLTSPSDSGPKTQDLTASGQVLGSPNYMAPEQASGQRAALTVRSDVYSLGAMLYHCLTGRPPFEAGSFEAVLARLASEEPARPRLLNPTVPRDLETICLKCLSKEPARRYGTAEELAEELGRFLRDEPVLAKPASRAERVWRWCRRKPALAGALGLLVLVFAIGASGVVWQWHRAEVAATVLSKEVYAADMEAAFRAALSGGVGNALRLLSKYLPSAGAAAGLRQWEWRYLWQECALLEDLSLGKLPGSVRALEFSPDSKWLAAATDQGAFGVWEIPSRVAVISTNVPEHRIDQVVFSPDSRRLAILTPTKSTYLWETNQPLVRRIRGGGARYAAFGPNGNILALSGGVSVEVYRLDPLLMVARLHETSGRRPSGLGFSPDDRTLAIGDDSGLCYLWDWRAQRDEESWMAQPKPPLTRDASPLSVTFSPDGKVLATAGLDMDVRLWSVPGHELLGVLAQAQRQASGPRFVQEGRALLTCDSSLRLRLWETGTWRPLQQLALPADNVFRMSAAPDGRSAALGGQDGSVQFWPADALATRRATPFPAEVVDEELDDEAGVLELVVEGNRWRVWDLKTRRELQTGPCPPDARGVLLSSRLPEVKFVIYTSDQKLGFWDLESAQFELIGAQDLGPGPQMEASGDGRLLACGGPRRVVVWDLASRHQLRSWEFKNDEDAGDLRLARNGAFIILATATGRLRRLDVLTGQTRDLPAVPGGCSGLTLARNGQRLAVLSGDSKLTVFDLARGQEIAAWDNGLDLKVEGLAFSPDADRLVAGTAEGRIQVWDVETQREVARLKGHLGRVHALGFVDADTLVSVGSDGLRYWRAPSLESIDKQLRAISRSAMGPGAHPPLSTSVLNNPHVRQGGWVQVTNPPSGTLGAGEIVATNLAGSITSATAQASVCLPPPKGLVAWWPGDGNARDLVGGHDGTVLNWAAFAPGQVGQAFRFDGVRDVVSVLDAPSLRPASVTGEGWFNFSSLGHIRSLLAKTAGSGVANSFDLWMLEEEVRTAIGDPDGFASELSYPLHPALGAWYHLAFTFDDATKLHCLYVDGILRATNSATRSIGYDSHPVTIGAEFETEFMTFFHHGLADEVSLYNRALTADEVRAIYNAGHAGKCKP